MNLKKLLIIAGVFLGFALGYGAVAIAYPPGGVFGRAERHGYFLGLYDEAGDRVWRRVPTFGGDALDPNIDTANEFIGYVLAKLTGPLQSDQDRVGASFIILTMIGKQGGTGTNPPSAADIAEWEARVRFAESMGRITWRTNYSFVLNSYYQGCCAGPNYNDDGFYDGPNTASSMVFGDGSGGGFGNVIYAIKWDCANPVGTLQALPDDLDFNMSGQTNVNDTTVSAGQVITFTHRLFHGSGSTGTSPNSINWTTQSASSPGGPWTNVSSGNAGTFAVGENKPNIGNQNVTVPNSPPGTQICRRITWTPDTQSGGTDASTPVCATIQYNFNLTPTVNATVTSGGVPITGNVAEQGDTITFTYGVNNSGSTVSQTITCTYRQATNPGNNTTPPVTVFTPSGANCPPPRTFPASTNTTTATEVNVPAATINTTICRSFTINPVTATGGSRTAQACVLVAAKPYARVWGGDVSAGNGLASASGACIGHNNNGAIVGWNRRSTAAFSSSYAGAGVQFGAFALARISDFASAMYDPGGAVHPTGLSFANMATVPASGNYGGDFRKAACITDYYATRPTSALPSIPATVAGMSNGVYGNSGVSNVTLGGGSIASANRITVYVDGNVHITSNITYGGSWDVNSIPLFELIVRGNIYIDRNVTQLDGVYVAQATSGGTGGQIHTCATGFGAMTPTTYYSNCPSKLTVNGLFTANQILLQRTNGTLSQATVGELSTTPFAAESFNFGPGIWLEQPVRQNQGLTPDYDAIITLPPIL